MSEYMHFIKILDNSLAEWLEKQGFIYMIEQNNKQKVYVFPIDSKLCELLKDRGAFTNGESVKAVYESTLRF